MTSVARAQAQPFVRPVAIVALAVAVAVATAFIVASTASAATAPFTSPLGSTAATSLKLATGGSTTFAAMSTSMSRASAPIATASAKRKAAVTRRASVGSTGASSGGELAQAKSLLASLVAQHPILAGTTVEIGDARGYQAISYYQSGRIVISASHSASLERIMNHEIWHIIDWRDNGRIDWGENVPPK